MNSINKYRLKESPTKQEKEEKKGKKRNYGECEDLEAKFTNLVIRDAIQVIDPVLDLSLLLGIYKTFCSNI